MKNKTIEWIEDENGCYICTSHCRNSSGYPQYCQKSHGTNMSRYIYEECFGPIPDGYEICHTCDNPGCINIEHLFVGTHKENMRDMFRKGRANRCTGEKHHSAKLTELDVVLIRFFRDSCSSETFASIHGVSPGNIRDIKAFRKWKSVSPETPLIEHVERCLEKEKSI